jgi:hypothetical protein
MLYERAYPEESVTAPWGTNSLATAFHALAYGCGIVQLKDLLGDGYGTDTINRLNSLHKRVHGRRVATTLTSGYLNPR